LRRRVADQQWHQHECADGRLQKRQLNFQRMLGYVDRVVVQHEGQVGNGSQGGLIHRH
jgi:hypothetical protein